MLAGCQSEPVHDYDAVTCRLDTIADVLGSSGSAVGTPAVEKRFAGQIDKIHRLVDGARASSGGRALAKLKRANHFLAFFTRKIDKGVRRGKIDAAVGQRLLSLAKGASDQLLPLQTALSVSR